MLDDVRHQFIDDQCQRDSHVGRHIHRLEALPISPHRSLSKVSRRTTVASSPV